MQKCETEHSDLSHSGNYVISQKRNKRPDGRSANGCGRLHPQTFLSFDPDHEDTKYDAYTQTYARTVFQVFGSRTRKDHV